MSAKTKRERQEQTLRARARLAALVEARRYEMKRDAWRRDMVRTVQILCIWAVVVIGFLFAVLKVSQ